MKKETNEILEKRFGRDSLISIATAVDNYPSCRTVDALYVDGAFYVITYLLSNKMKQIEKNSIVGLAGEWFTGHGVATNLGWFNDKNNEVYAKKLHDAFALWIDNGHNNFDDPNTIILRIEVTDCVVYADGKCYSF